ncbi:hypothetical protein RHO14_03460 [Orbus wheelerorum]|uniref:DUF7079 family protein n=1 Tax=Orbus wheelerorum TaxID=3074111 RepID=UPI00370DB10F
MGNILSKEELYVALSDLFAADQIDYDYIASVAKLFPIESVEYALFNYVAPVCYYNTVTSFCISFDKDDLISNINRVKQNENSFFGRMKMYFFSKYLQLKFNHEWKTLKNLL